MSDRAIASKIWETVAINNAAASGDLTVKAIAAGERFVVFHLFLQSEGATDVSVKSASTSLTGAVLTASGDEFEWKNSGFPVFVGTATGDDFILNVSAAVQVNGFATIGVIKQ